VFRDEATGARLQRRGVELGCRPGEEIGAVLPGVVAYAGPVRGLGMAMVIDHGEGVVTVTGRLERAFPGRGLTVRPGEPIGVASGDRVYLEVRRGGRPVDPEPLLNAGE
jgi:septal ring factor EnvC (AmiA/AmiB activator)